jgi:hypothetical protein
MLSVVLLLLGVMVIWVSPGARAMQPVGSVTEASWTGNVRSVSAPAATPTCEPSWSIVSSPNFNSRNNELYGVSAVAPNDVWAVGYRLEAGVQKQKNPPQPKAWHPLLDSRISHKDGYGVVRTLVEHWNGTAWAITVSPNVGQDDNSLLEVDAVSANDVWAVGYYISDLGLIQTLAQHWDGTRWSVIPTPNNGLQDNLLNSVDAVSANDVWAVGYYVNKQGITQTLIQHWDGTRWSIVPSPNAGAGENLLRDVAVVSARDIWAVGYHIIPRGIYRTLVMHWDGSTWSVVPSPNVASETQLYSVSVVAANDVWAVGYYRDTRSVIRTLTIHWDGSAWSVIPSPSVGPFDSQLFSVDAISANDVWAVGRYVNEYYVLQTLILHWDGRAWGVARSPNRGEYMDNILFAVDAISTTDVWSVGRSGGYSSAPQTLTEHYSTVCVSCSLRFSDVPEGSTFYPYIQCLACQGIISGYECGAQPGDHCGPGNIPYFRPNANITRGQLAKVVSNSAGFLENPGGQIFMDVHQYTPFYPWINRLARRGIIGGYPCGTVPEEPCYPPENMPYFRPYADATRGQISKIVANAANFTEPPVGQTFQDVPPSSPFYTWIERLASRGVMGGYQCGGAGEPCRVPPRPYFRPNNNATRGQVSKIVANTFFPNCYTPAQR